MSNLSKATGRGSLNIGQLQHDWGTRTLVMGIVNTTPDSFSGDGIMAVDKAVQQAVDMLVNGADIIDVGGESTRPGHVSVTAQEEISRVVPIISALRATATGAPISIDTTKPEVFAAALKAGANILNSIWMPEGALADLLLESRVPVVLMHNKHQAVYQSTTVVEEVLSALQAKAEQLVAQGMRAENIILDPGIGFGKTGEHNLAVMASLHLLPSLGYPTLLGASRKSFIGAILGQSKTPQERDFGTCAITALAVNAGIDIVRVHNVPMAHDVVRVSDAIVRSRLATSGTEP